MLWGLSLCGRFTLLKHRFHSICHRCWRKSPGAYEVWGPKPIILLLPECNQWQSHCSGDRVWWISRVSWQTQQISGVLEVWSWWSSPSPSSSSPTWAMIFPVLTARATSLHCWRSNRPKVVQFDICPVFTIEDVLLCVTVVMTNRNWSKQWHCRWRGVNIVVLRQFRMFLGKRPRASIQQLVTPWPPCSPPRMGTGQQKGCLAQKLLAAGNDWRKRTSEGGAKTWFVPRYLALTKDVVWRCQMMCKGVFYPP